jgi:hypothetical protein
MRSRADADWPVGHGGDRDLEASVATQMHEVCHAIFCRSIRSNLVAKLIPATTVIVTPIAMAVCRIQFINLPGCP